MAVDQTTNKILDELAEHLAGCCLLALKQQGFDLPHGGRFYEKLLDQIRFNVVLRDA